MRVRPRLLALLSLTTLLGCRQPTAELTLTEPSGAEPSGVDSPPVFVEAPRPPEPGPILEWNAVDDRLASLIEGARYRVDYDADHPWTGASSPLVTIVVFYDYQCPFSKRLHESLLPLLSSYGDSLRVVWRQLPLASHPQAELAARHALSAHAQQLFEPMHAWLFDNAKSLSPSNIQAQAGALGLDPMRLSADVDSEWIAGRVQADLELASTRGIRATPTFFINGRLFRGALAPDALEAAIREELAAAQRLVEAGSERREVWARFMAAADDGVIAEPRASSSGPDPNKRYAMQVSGLTPRGAKQPKVEILMCGDFDCPYCSRATATLTDLLKRHKKTLAVYFRHMPLPMHTDAMAAHRAAVAADNQGEFWAMFDLLYADQRARTPADLEAMASKAGLKLAQFRSDIADPATDQLIEQQREFCEKQLDSRGTPTFFINGRPLMGAVPIEEFEKIIKEELAATP
ncbi:MAG TPA: thioredoxin domain-containing protein [Enhygromyxa sp.]|nr:thioredoxin domain-containing protein [Enhygromyxa sp.]